MTCLDIKSSSTNTPVDKCWNFPTKQMQNVPLPTDKQSHKILLNLYKPTYSIIVFTKEKISLLMGSLIGSILAIVFLE